MHTTRPKCQTLTNNITIFLKTKFTPKDSFVIIYITFIPNKHFLFFFVTQSNIFWRILVTIDFHCMNKYINLWSVTTLGCRNVERILLFGWTISLREIYAISCNSQFRTFIQYLYSDPTVQYRERDISVISLVCDLQIGGRCVFMLWCFEFSCSARTTTWF